MMRYLFLLISLTPLLAYGLGAEQSSYYAIYPDNRVVSIDYLSDGESWNNSNFLYGSRSENAYRYCWINSSSVEFLFCSRTKKQKKVVVYRTGSESGKTHREAMSLFKKNVKLGEYGSLMGYYVCDKNCTSSVSKFVFSVGHSGC